MRRWAATCTLSPVFTSGSCARSAGPIVIGFESSGYSVQGAGHRRRRFRSAFTFFLTKLEPSWLSKPLKPEAKGIFARKKSLGRSRRANSGGNTFHPRRIWPADDNFGSGRGGGVGNFVQRQQGGHLAVRQRVQWRSTGPRTDMGRSHLSRALRILARRGCQATRRARRKTPPPSEDNQYSQYTP